MNISTLRDCSVFLDTNILIYAFTSTKYTTACELLLDNIRDRVVKGHLNSTVIDEFFHKVLLMQVYTKKRIAAGRSGVILKTEPGTCSRFYAPV